MQPIVALPARLRSVLLVLSGTAGGQIALVGATPILARLYEPHELGVYSYVHSLSLILAGVAGLRLEWAITLPVNDGLSYAVFRAYMISSIGVGCAALLAIGLLSATVPDVSAVPFPAIWYMPFLTVAICAFSGLGQAALRARLYGAVGKRALTQGVTTVLIQVGLGFASAGAGALLLGQLLARSLSSATLALKLPSLGGLRLSSSFTQVLRQYWRFPVLYMPSAFLNLLGTYFPIIAVTYMFGAESAGYLGMAQTVSLAPVALLGAAVSQVFIGELTANLRVGASNNRLLYLRASGGLLLFAVLLFLALVLGGSWIVPKVLGQQWAESGGLMGAMAVGIAAGLVASPLSFVFVAYQRAVLSLFVDASRVFMVCGAAYFAHLTEASLHESVLWMSIGQACNYLLTWTTGLIVSGNRPRGGAARHQGV